MNKTKELSPVEIGQSLQFFKQIILNELRKGNSISSIDQVYQHLSTNAPFDILKPNWPEIKDWWNNLIELIYMENVGDCEEISISACGTIFTKKQNTWDQNSEKIEPIDATICSYYLQNFYHEDINLKTPFKSFTGVKNDLSYRFSIQLVKIRPIPLMKIFIRINRKNIFPLTQFGINLKTFDHVLEGNIIISGATGSGKTTFLKSILATEKLNNHHLIIEDLNEIGNISTNSTQLCSSDIGQEMKTLLTNGLRMSPNKIILGEIRGPEVLPYMMALNSGHEGSLATIHANSAVETIYRICELLQIFGNFGDNSFSQLMRLVSRNIRYVIYLENKLVKEIIKVQGSSDKGTPYFEKMPLLSF